jgi:hypothetical protein
VHALKYQDRTDLAPTMGRWMARAGGELLAGAAALVPVPLHWRRGHRRFNQSGALAAVIARQSGARLKAELRERARATEQQVGLSRVQRASNVQGALRVPTERQSEVLGTRIVLIEDVLTSGATVDACAPRPPRSTCRSLPGLSIASKLPYNWVFQGSRIEHERWDRNLYPPGLRLLQCGQIVAEPQKGRVHRV